MKNDEFPMLHHVPKVGSEFVKLKTGEIVKWQSFDEKSQMFEVELPNGEVSEIHRRDVEMPTSNEELVKIQI
jgi:hypothetical protein